MKGRNLFLGERGRLWNGEAWREASRAVVCDKVVGASRRRVCDKELWSPFNERASTNPKERPSASSAWDIGAATDDTIYGQMVG